MSNTDLLRQTVSNFKRQQTRGIVFGFGLTYDATPEQLAEVPQRLRRLVEADPQLEFRRAHFKSFGDSSLDFEVVYIVRDPSYDVYMDRQQALNLALMKELATMGLQFAFPSRTVYTVTPAAPT